MPLFTVVGLVVVDAENAIVTAEVEDGSRFVRGSSGKLPETRETEPGSGLVAPQTSPLPPRVPVSHLHLSPCFHVDPVQALRSVSLPYHREHCWPATCSAAEAQNHASTEQGGPSSNNTHLPRQPSRRTIGLASALAAQLAFLDSGCEVEVEGQTSHET